MNYETFSTEDFAMDPLFVKWVRNPGEEDHRFWKEWLVLHPEKEKEIEEARRLVAFLNFSVVEPGETLKSAIRERIHDGLVIEQGRSKTLNQTQRTPWYRLVAAIVGILIAFSAALYIYNTSRTNMMSTGFDEVERVELPDGSVVTLNRNSSLRYKDLTAVGDREVWLQGEAYFEVKKSKENSKFIVKMEDIHVEVLGTEFNITNRNGRTGIVLNTGTLRVVHMENEEQKREILMDPGDLVEYTASSKKMVQKDVNPERFISWTKNLVLLEESSLADIGELLESTYGYHVEMEEDLKNLLFTGAVPADNIAILFLGLEKTHALDITVEGKNVLIRRSGG